MTEAAEHPDVDEISDLTETLLTPARSEEIRRHLELCVDCREVYESLEEIRGLLGTLPPSTPMPVDVAERIDAALAAEALLAATAPECSSTASASSSSASLTEASAEDSAEDDAPHGGAHVSRETSTAPRTDRPAGHARRSASGPGRGQRTRGRRRMVGLGAVFTLAALGLGGIIVQVTGDGGTTGNGSTTAGGGGVSLSEKNLESRVGELMAQRKGQPSTESRTDKPSFDVRSSPDGSDSQAPLRKEDVPSVKIPSCIQEGTGRKNLPLAAEKGTFNGKSAFLVVLPHATDAKQVSAYVVDASCAEQRGSDAGKLLSTHSYARR
ncbi:hypothetical protein HUT18_16845 [Streptomyces sp. NA04227]|uniref:anti-sigma factor family protein n=1 Tax=Streptomyces sp. NA04227 TaxID=2742136 RepID=UPI001590B266|nr:hypothetical protein [Streptomyces sp. NA04227]QKW07802.1 hypothetical protein HUT18_16845 [Streptomyces sp. NA04227]